MIQLLNIDEGPTCDGAPEIQIMTAEEFVDLYLPSCYYSEWNWDVVSDNDDFIRGGDESWDMDELYESMAEEGMLNPVEVINKSVMNGHHRVFAALAVGADVRFQVWQGTQHT